MARKFSIIGLTEMIVGGGSLLLVAVAVILIGGATTAVVMAAIPDSSGTIHACYTTNGKNAGSLRVIDTENGDTCTKTESSLSWSQGNQQGVPQMAYGYLVGTQPNGADDTLDANRSKNVVDAKVFLDTDPQVSGYVACITVSFNPKNISESGSGRSPAATSVRTPGLDPGNNGWSGPYGAQANSACGASGANAFIESISNNQFFALFE